MVLCQLLFICKSCLFSRWGCKKIFLQILQIIGLALAWSYTINLLLFVLQHSHRLSNINPCLYWSNFLRLPCFIFTCLSGRLSINPTGYWILVAYFISLSLTHGWLCIYFFSTPQHISTLHTWCSWCLFYLHGCYPFIGMSLFLLVQFMVGILFTYFPTKQITFTLTFRVVLPIYLVLHTYPPFTHLQGLPWLLAYLALYGHSLVMHWFTLSLFSPFQHTSLTIAATQQQWGGYRGGTSYYITRVHTYARARELYDEYERSEYEEYSITKYPLLLPHSNINGCCWVVFMHGWSGFYLVTFDDEDER